jgi:hypothetical protein
MRETGNYYKILAVKSHGRITLKQQHVGVGLGYRELGYNEHSNVGLIHEPDLIGLRRTVWRK